MSLQPEGEKASACRRVEQLGASCPDESGEAYDLSGAQFEADLMPRMRGRPQARDGQNDVSGRLGGMGVKLGKVASHH